MIAFNRLRTLAIPSAALLTAVVSAPTSHADTDAFYHDVTSIGITSSGGEQGVIQDGEEICAALKSGMTPEAAATTFFYNSYASRGSNNGVSLEQARKEVTFAVNDLCPPESR